MHNILITTLVERIGLDRGGVLAAEEVTLTGILMLVVSSSRCG